MVLNDSEKIFYFEVPAVEIIPDQKDQSIRHEFEFRKLMFSEFVVKPRSNSVSIPSDVLQLQSAPELSLNSED